MTNNIRAVLMMNKLTLGNGDMEVSVRLRTEAGLDDAIMAVEGMLKTLGYCFYGKLDLVEEHDVEGKLQNQTEHLVEGAHLEKKEE